MSGLFRLVSGDDILYVSDVDPDPRDGWVKVAASKWVRPIPRADSLLGGVEPHVQRPAWGMGDRA